MENHGTFFLMCIVFVKRSVVNVAHLPKIKYCSFRSESTCKRGSHTTYFLSASLSADCCVVAMINVVLIHGFDTVYLHQGISYIASSGLLPFNLKLITSGTSFLYSLQYKAEGTRNILLSKRDVADVLWLESLNGSIYLWVYRLGS